MASNYTENYQLPLWQPEDDFVRTEFNDAHEKIDGAIWEASRVVKLADVTLTEASDAIVLSLAGVDLTDYCRLELWLPKLLAVGGGTVKLRANDVADSVYYIRSVSGGSTQNEDYIMAVNPNTVIDGENCMASAVCYVDLFDNALCGRTEYPHVDTWQQNCSHQMNIWSVYPGAVSRETLTHLTVSCTVPLLAGSRAVLLGVRI